MDQYEERFLERLSQANLKWVVEALLEDFYWAYLGQENVLSEEAKGVVEQYTGRLDELFGERVERPWEEE